MTHARISVAWLMGLVLLAAVALAGLREGTFLWANLTFTSTLILLLGAVLNALFHRGRSRASWAGFALFGWTYALLHIGSWSDIHNGPPPLPMSWLLDELHERIHPAPEYIPNPQATTPSLSYTIPQFVPPMMVKPGSFVWGGQITYYRQVGHSVGIVLFGALGALWGRYIAARPAPAPTEAGS